MYDGTPLDGPSDYEYAIAARVGMGYPPVGPLTQAQDAEQTAYDAWCAEMESMCGVGISTGGHDPYGTSCDLPRGHDGPHEGPDFFGVGRLKWTGGGSCAGDPLPVHIIEHEEA